MRNQHNNREYNLFLTEAGWRVFNDHHKFEQACYARTFQKLEIFTDEELELYCRVQQRLNEARGLLRHGLHGERLVRRVGFGIA